ncbi:hypothetical protein TrVGV298_005522 [Trichoderma virens]|nr:hypothetical protein TrVGV298_005522 [Trichoderma virens]
MQYWASGQFLGGDDALQLQLPAPDYSVTSFSIEENIESIQSLDYFTVDDISGSQPSLLPGPYLPNPESLYLTYDNCSHPPSVPFSSSKALSITGGRKHGCTTTASYLSGPRSVDEVFSHKSFSTTHTNLRSEQNGALCNFGSKQVNTAEPNAGNQTIQRCSSGRKRSRQIEKSRTGSKSRRVDEMDEDEDASGRSYSCPFYLRSPADYGEGKWELCANGGWPSYHRVREHLLRKHIQPTIVCDRCFEDFKDDVGLKKHDASICEKKEHSPYLNKNQQREIEAPIKRGMREAEKLEHMCRRIFPDEVILNPNINHLELRLRSVIASFLDASFTDGFRQQTVQHIMDVTLQEIRNVSYTAGAKQVHNHQRCDGVENA